MGIGSPIMDVLARVDDAVLASVGGAKGGMEMMDAATMDRWIQTLPGGVTQVPGGSASNTVGAMARLGVRVALLGKLGDDETATRYTEQFLSLGGSDARFKRGTGRNGRCLSLVTPDSQRTMRTDLGAAATLSPDEVQPSDFAGVRHVHIEGYVLFNRDLMLRVLELAKTAGCTVSLDLASFEVVGAAKDILPGLLEKYVDIVFANEDEAAAYHGSSGDFRELAARFAQICPVAAVKVGKKGAHVATAGTVHDVAPLWVDHPVDTTGAGDLWAAGFLTGWLRGHDFAQCGRFGSILGAEIVQVLGAAIPEDRWLEIKKHF
ncbi:MAG: adenosine kinase [Candidatus Methylacidiphilales bacterium]|nr:adenosine kinase [Candidatus Methylacidiphilales bacterium]